MKLQVELTYTLADEPTQFKSTSETHSRKVYVWQDQRGYFENTDAQWFVFNRASTMIETPTSGFLEYWHKSANEISPPKDVDDIWAESYKLIVKPKLSVEWHPEIHQLRLTWTQSSDTLHDKKLLAAVLDEIKSMDLLPPLFPAQHP
jgi:hypothetical protein